MHIPLQTHTPLGFTLPIEGNPFLYVNHSLVFTSALISSKSEKNSFNLQGIAI